MNKHIKPSVAISEKSGQSLDTVLNSVDSAQGLSNAWYTEEAYFSAERQAIFFSQWSGVGFAKDIPNRGDAKPVEFLGIPLLLVRVDAETVRVYQNTCRHRGMILVDAPTTLKGVIRCPYHSWCYGLDGTLKTTPHVGGPAVNTHESIDRATLGLVEIPSYVYRDVVFVNISGNAPPFTTVHADLIERWREFDQPLYHGGEDSSFKLDVNTNWKLAVENYCESYHLPWVHPGLNSYSRLEDHYNIVEYDKFSGQGTTVYRPTLAADGRAFEDFAQLSAKWDTAAEYITLAPNVLFGVHRDHAFAIILEAKAVDRTVEHIELYYASPAMQDEGYAALRRENARLWKTVFEEDIFVVEGMQRGRAGVYFDGGRFSAVMDEPTHVFHHWVATRLKEYLKAA